MSIVRNDETIENAGFGNGGFGNGGLGCGNVYWDLTYNSLPALIKRIDKENGDALKKYIESGEPIFNDIFCKINDLDITYDPIKQPLSLWEVFRKQYTIKEFTDFLQPDDIGRSMVFNWQDFVYLFYSFWFWRFLFNIFNIDAELMILYETDIKISTFVYGNGVYGGGWVYTNGGSITEGAYIQYYWNGSFLNELKTDIYIGQNDIVFGYSKDYYNQKYSRLFDEGVRIWFTYDDIINYIDKSGTYNGFYGLEKDKYKVTSFIGFKFNGAIEAQKWKNLGNIRWKIIQFIRKFKPLQDYFLGFYLFINKTEYITTNENINLHENVFMKDDDFKTNDNIVLREAHLLQKNANFNELLQMQQSWKHTDNAGFREKIEIKIV